MDAIWSIWFGPPNQMRVWGLPFGLVRQTKWADEWFIWFGPPNPNEQMSVPFGLLHLGVKTNGLFYWPFGLFGQMTNSNGPVFVRFVWFDRQSQKQIYLVIFVSDI